MRIGTIIQNDDMTLTVVAYHETKNSNVALLVREEVCHYITVRDLTHEKNGKYHWYYGHYIHNIGNAVKDFFDRKATLS